jgi:dihydroorotate dehydrogenase
MMKYLQAFACILSFLADLIYVNRISAWSSQGTRDRMRWGPIGPPPLVVKIAPDLTDEDKQVTLKACP